MFRSCPVRDEFICQTYSRISEASSKTFIKISEVISTNSPAYVDFWSEVDAKKGCVIYQHFDE